MGQGPYHVHGRTLSELLNETHSNPAMKKYLGFIHCQQVSQ